MAEPRQLAHNATTHKEWRVEAETRFRASVVIPAAISIPDVFRIMLSPKLIACLPLSTKFAKSIQIIFENFRRGGVQKRR